MNVGNNDDHADNTWVDQSSGTNWLSDFLPGLVPNARILATNTMPISLLGDQLLE
jgi:hypothetical protein